MTQIMTRFPPARRQTWRVTRRFVSGLTSAALSAALMLHMPNALALEAGDKAPEFELPAARGGSLSLSEMQGKVVWVDFWASWCGPCRASFPWMNAMVEKYGPQGFAVLAINVDADRPLAEAFLQDNPAGFPVVFDAEGKTPESFGVRGMPSSYLVDGQGRLIGSHIGFRASAMNDYENAIRQALGLPPLP